MRCAFPPGCETEFEVDFSKRGRRPTQCPRHKCLPNGDSNRNEIVHNRLNDAYVKAFCHYEEYKDLIVWKNGKPGIELDGSFVPLACFHFAHGLEEKNIEFSQTMNRFQGGCDNWNEIKKELEFGVFLLPCFHTCIDNDYETDELPFLPEWKQLQKKLINKYIFKIKE